jgi:lysine 2,3-aminomutase
MPSSYRLNNNAGEKKEGTVSATLLFLSTSDALSGILPLDQSARKEIDAVSESYPFRIPQYYANLMEKDNPFCPLRLQAVPSAMELRGGGKLDPLAEGGIQITPSLIKRYPKRAVFLVSSECAMYCRFCNRKRAVGKGHVWEESVEETLRYLDNDREISEVILSGGDPLMLPPVRLAYILDRLRSNRHIHVVRISTRLPVVFPQGIRQDHFVAIRKHAPIWVITHTNHPRELTPEFGDAVAGLREAGAVLISQTVLLRGINDCPHILSELFERLVCLGVKPYYLFQLDDVQGAQHFKVKVSVGMALMRELRMSLSGLCIPQYALDITGGLGKVPLEHKYVRKKEGRRLVVENPAGERGAYLDDGGDRNSKS